MKKKTLISIILLILSLNINAQTDSINNRGTVYDNYISQKGLKIKFEDKKLSKISYGISSNTYLKCKLRIVEVEGIEKKYFVILGEGDDNIIEYSDLINVNKELERLLKEIDIDISQNPDYIENKYISNDGFVIGYYIEGKKSKWFMQLYYRPFKLSPFTGYGTKDIYKIEKFSEGLKNILKEVEDIIQKL